MSEHFDLQALTDLIGQNAMAVNTLASSVGSLQKEIDNVSDKVNSVEDSVVAIRQDIADIKENEEITFSQQQNIRSAVNARVYTLLNVPHKRDERTISDKVTIKKYASLFHRRCYTEVQRKGHLADPYRTTTKKDYDDAMREITEWFPKNGIEALKKEADENALARRIAEEQGYK